MAASFMAIILKKKQQAEDHALRCGSRSGYGGKGLSPLMEGPTPENFETISSKQDGKWGCLQWWVKGQLLTKAPSMARVISKSSRLYANVESYKQSDVCLLLGIFGAPLAPIALSETKSIPFLSVKTLPLETSSAQYIVQQYMCATGAAKLNNVRNSYAMGRVKMAASEFQTASEVGKTMMRSCKCAQSGFFVVWHMMPNMWSVEMAVGGSKVHAGSNGKLVWRHTPWLGSHAAKGPVRPLRRALQGLDPRIVANVFWEARCIGEKKVRDEDCFILKLAADAATLAARSEGPAEIIRHVLLGYFSQKTGLLVQVEDSHLTRMQSTTNGDTLFWETNIDSSIDDYRDVEGVMIAHSGRSTVTLFRFGGVAMSHTKTRLEEEWSIDEVAFNVAGLSAELFMPPADISTAGIPVSDEPSTKDRDKCCLFSNRNNVAALHESSQDNIWTVEV